MARKKKASNVQKFVTVGVILIAVQAVYLFVFGRKPKPKPFMELVKQSVEQIPNLSSKQKEEAKIQMAVADFISQNKGQLPQSLDVLVPKYFERVPVDPESNQPFKYKVDGNNFIIGDEKKPTPSATPGATQVASAGAPERPLTTDEQNALLLESVTGKVIEDTFIYNPAGKRDPFQPFDLAPKTPSDDGTKTPLEKYTLGQLKLTAVLGGGNFESTAIVELAGGRGYTVKKGTKIGPNGGVVVEIKSDRLLILETTIDFTGEKRTQTLELILNVPKHDDEPQSPRR